MGNAAGSLPYDLENEQVGREYLHTFSPWTAVQHGVAKASKGPAGITDVTVFRLEGKDASAVARALAANELSRTKILRHPDVLTFVDGMDTDAGIQLVTEAAQPLQAWLTQQPQETAVEREKLRMNCVWGLRSIANALSFLNDDCHMVHGSVCPHSVFVTQSGRWKLGALCTVQPESEDWGAWLGTHGVRSKFQSPEAADGFRGVRGLSASSQDVWGLGKVLEFVEDLLGKDAGGLPLRRMLASRPTSRPNAGDLLSSPLFDNMFVKCMLFLDNLALKDDASKANFFKGLATVLETFPDAACRYVVLPALVASLSVTSDSHETIALLTPLLAIASNLPQAEFERQVEPTVIGLFKRPDRATRLQLLQKFSTFVDNLSAKLINSEVFPAIVTGFTDTEKHIRLATVQTMPAIVGRLDSAKNKGLLLKHMKKVLTDQVPVVRVNTVICIGLLAKDIEATKRAAELFPCFVRALKDPYPHVRVAAIKAVAHTMELYDLKLLATQVFPRIVCAAVDPFAEARDVACEALTKFADAARAQSKERALADAEVADAVGTGSGTTDASNGGFSSGGWLSGMMGAGGGGNGAPAGSASEAVAPADPKPPRTSFANSDSAVAAPQTTAAREPSQPVRAVPQPVASEWDDDWGDFGDDTVSSAPPAAKSISLGRKKETPREPRAKRERPVRGSRRATASSQRPKAASRISDETTMVAAPAVETVSRPVSSGRDDSGFGDSDFGWGGTNNPASTKTSHPPKATAGAPPPVQPASSLLASAAIEAEEPDDGGWGDGDGDGDGWDVDGDLATSATVTSIAAESKSRQASVPATSTWDDWGDDSDSHVPKATTATTSAVSSSAKAKERRIRAERAARAGAETATSASASQTPKTGMKLGRKKADSAKSRTATPGTTKKPAKKKGLGAKPVKVTATGGDDDWFSNF